jgi:hypothetical protein
MEKIRYDVEIKIPINELNYTQSPAEEETKEVVHTYTHRTYLNKAAKHGAMETWKV